MEKREKKLLDWIEQCILYTDEDDIKAELIKSKDIVLKKIGLEKSNLYLITISFRDEDLEISMLPHVISKKLTRKWIQSYKFNIEQRGETPDDFSGVHAHVVVQCVRPKSICHMTREMYNSFKKCVDSPRYINVRRITYDNGVDDYLLGNKIDSDKHAKVANDKLFRQKYNLQDIYKNDMSVS